MDKNLNSHHNVTDAALIHLYGDSVVYQAPYSAVDTKIEYIFKIMFVFIQG